MVLKADSGELNDKLIQASAANNRHGCLTDKEFGLTLECDSGEILDEQASPIRECAQCRTNKESAHVTSEADSGEKNDNQEQITPNVADALICLTNQESKHMVLKADSGELNDKLIQASAANNGHGCLTDKEFGLTLECDSGEIHDEQASLTRERAHCRTNKESVHVTSEADSGEKNDNQEQMPSVAKCEFSYLTELESVQLTSEYNFSGKVNSGKVNIEEEKSSSMKISELIRLCNDEPSHIMAINKSVSSDKEIQSGADIIRGRFLDLPVGQKLMPIGLHTDNERIMQEQDWVARSYEQPFVHVGGKKLVISQSVPGKRIDDHSVDESEDWFNGDLVDADSISAENSDMEISRKLHASLESSSIVEAVERQGSTTPDTEGPTGERLVIGKSILNKSGKQSISSLSISHTGACGKQREVREPTGSSSLPVQRTLFTVESTPENYDIQQDQFGDTVMLSLKRKSNRKVQGETTSTISDDECLLVSPIQKKVMLAMRNKGRDADNGELHNAQNADSEAKRSTVFLLKRKRIVNGSPRKIKSIFASPLKKKLKFPKRRPNRLFAKSPCKTAKNGPESADQNETNADKKQGSTSLSAKLLRKSVKLKRLHNKQYYASKRKRKQLSSSPEHVSQESSEDQADPKVKRSMKNKKKKPVGKHPRMPRVACVNPQVPRSVPISRLKQRTRKTKSSPILAPELNPTFKKLYAYSGKKLKKSVFGLKESEGKLAIKVARSVVGSVSSKGAKARCLVKWCLVARRRLIAQFKKNHDDLTAKCEDWVTTAEQYQTLAQKTEAMLGVPQHTHRTESYFYETAYKEMRLKCHGKKQKQNGQVSFPVLRIRQDGKVMNIFPATENDLTWNCGSLCKSENKTSLRKVGRIFRKLKRATLPRHMINFLRDMNNCKGPCRHSHKRGHSASYKIRREQVHET